MVFRRGAKRGDFPVARSAVQSRRRQTAGRYTGGAVARVVGPGAVRRNRRLRDRDAVSRRRGRNRLGGNFYFPSADGADAPHNDSRRVLGRRRRGGASSGGLSLRAIARGVERCLATSFGSAPGRRVTGQSNVSCVGPAKRL